MLSLTKVSGAYISTKNAYGDGKPRRGNDFIRGHSPASILSREKLNITG